VFILFTGCIDDLDELEIRKTIQDLTKYGRGKFFSEKEIKELPTISKDVDTL
jgi:hypothetical protein